MACPSFSFVPCWFLEVQEPEQDDGSTWEQQANDVWSGGKRTGKRMGRVHTKRVGTNLNDCEHGKARSVCMQGCGGGSICEHGKARSVCTQGCGGGGICEHGKRRSRCKQGCRGKQPLADALAAEPIGADESWLRAGLNIEKLKTEAPVEIRWGGEWWYLSSFLSLGRFGDVFSCVPITG